MTQELSEQVAYLRGLVEGYEFSEGKSRILWEKALHVLELAAGELVLLKKEQGHLQEYIEAIDEDLGFLEDHYYPPDNTEEEEEEIRISETDEAPH